ncbi:MAG: ankyrin repeat domain-containing protein [Candidatus Babeliales bacterium]
MHYTHIKTFIIISMLLHTCLITCMQQQAVTPGQEVDALLDVYRNGVSSHYYQVAARINQWPLALTTAISDKNIHACLFRLPTSNLEEWRAKKNKSTLLHFTASVGYFSFCKFLLMTGIQWDLSLQNKRGKTPFSCAALKGHMDICELLVRHNPDNPGLQDDWPQLASTIKAIPAIVRHLKTEQVQRMLAQSTFLPDNRGLQEDWQSLTCIIKAIPEIMGHLKTDQDRRMLTQSTLLPFIPLPVLIFKLHDFLEAIEPLWNSYVHRRKDVNVFPLLMQHKAGSTKQIPILSWQGAEESVQKCKDELLYILPFYQLHKERNNATTPTVDPFYKMRQTQRICTLLAIHKLRAESPISWLTKDVIRYKIVPFLIGNDVTDCVNQQLILLQELLSIIECRKDATRPLNVAFNPKLVEQHREIITNTTRKLMN